MLAQTALQDKPPLQIDTQHRIYFKDSCKMTETEVASNSVHLVVTSPPYWQIKDYGNDSQIGYGDTLEGYLTKLGKVWEQCVRVLMPGGRMCINIGDQYTRGVKKPFRPYQIEPLHAYVVNNIMDAHQDEILYLGSIIWKKIPTTKTSGGASVMGSYGYPRNGYVSYNYEYIAIFKKKGTASIPDTQEKEKARIGLKEWRKLFRGIWKFNGAQQIGGIAVFPDELPRRLMRMFTYEKDVCLDPFLGSATTTKVALEMKRNSIGYEIGFKSPEGVDCEEIIKQKIGFYDVPSDQRHRVFSFLDASYVEQPDSYQLRV